MVTRFTNYFGGLPEYLFIHGEPSRDWYIDGHACFAIALAETLVRRDGDKIMIFPCGTANLPKKLSFSNFLLPGAILVSVKYGKELSVKIENLSGVDQKITIESGKHNETVVIKSSAHFEKTIASR